MGDGVVGAGVGAAPPPPPDDGGFGLAIVVTGKLDSIEVPTELVAVTVTL